MGIDSGRDALYSIKIRSQGVRSDESESGAEMSSEDMHSPFADRSPRLGAVWPAGQSYSQASGTIMGSKDTSHAMTL